MGFFSVTAALQACSLGGTQGIRLSPQDSFMTAKVFWIRTWWGIELLLYCHSLAFHRNVKQKLWTTIAAGVLSHSS
jgi:hypothetical protein